MTTEIPGVDLIQCYCVDGRNVTEVEQLMAAHLNTDVFKVHDFLCTWERFSEHVLDRKPLVEDRCRSWRWRVWRPIRCVYGVSHTESSKWHCSKNGGHVWKVGNKHRLAR